VGYSIRKIHQRTTTSSFRAYRVPLNNVDTVKNLSNFYLFTNLTSSLRLSMPLSASSRVPLRYLRPVLLKLTKQKQNKISVFWTKKSATLMKHFCNLSCFLQLHRVPRIALFCVITQRMAAISYRVLSPVGKTQRFLVCCNSHYLHAGLSAVC